MRILGIDPGLNVTGYGVVDVARGTLRLCEAGVVRASRNESIAVRVEEIHRGVCDVITALQPQVMAIEQLYSHYQRPRTAILMGHARGVICLAATQAAIPVVHYAATQIKKILTGNGRAPKQQMQSAIKRELSLDQVPEPPDVADALAVALCHHYLGKQSWRHDAGANMPSAEGEEPDPAMVLPETKLATKSTSRSDD